MKAKAKWINGFQSVINNDRYHSVVTDLPVEENGEGCGPTALELTVMSLAGCISTIFSLRALKMRLNFCKFTAEVEAEKPEGAQTITTVKAKIQLTSDDDEEKLRTCVEKSIASCPVGVLFEQAGIKISHDLKINKENY